MSGEDTHECQGDGSHDDYGCDKIPEPGYDQDVYEYQDSSEGNPQVPEYLVCYVPLPIPFHGVFVLHPWLDR